MINGLRIIILLRLDSTSCHTSVDVDSLLKKSESQHESPDDGCPFGPLTQRLLQALVEVRLLKGSVAESSIARSPRLC